MDNTNDPNLPPTSPPVPGAPPTPPPTTPSWPPEPVNTPPPNPVPSWPPVPPVPPVQQPDPLANTSTPPWSPPQPIPVQPQPTSTFTTPTAPETPAATTSPLDNPWGAPTQAPAIDTTSQPSWMTNSAPIEQPPTPTQTENAPTDLSQLIAGSGAAPAEPNTLNPATPETLVVSQPNAETPEVPTLPSNGHKGIPKWLIGIGIGLLLIVVGASAYFILGIGQSPKTTSVPAVTQSSNTVKPPAPIATQVPQPTAPPEASGSSSFGQLGGTTRTATRAGDLMNQPSPKP